MEKILAQIQEFADKAHGDQQRKYSPEKYIMHPVRVMETCKEYTGSLPVLAAALLHDVLEDTRISNEQLQDYLLNVMSPKDAGHTLQLVNELTDVYTKASYPGMNRRRRKIKETERMGQVSAEAQTIKYADIMDNSREIALQDPPFAPVYLRECRSILQKMTRGNKDLYHRSLQVVEDELRKLD